MPTYKVCQDKYSEGLTFGYDLFTVFSAKRILKRK